MQEPEGVEPGHGTPTTAAERGDAIAGARTDASTGIDTGTSTSTSAQHQTLDVRFVGSGSEYFRIWIVNLLLTLVTLGIYYPFAKCRRLRYFHACTEVGGHPLHFHGNPRTMLRGYALMLVMTVLYSLADHLSPLAGLAAMLLVSAMGPALWYSSMRFRLANTSWRGVRLRFTGTLGAAYSALGPAVSAFTLFFVAAWWTTMEIDAHPGAWEDPPLVPLYVMILVNLVAFPWFAWRSKHCQHSNYEYTTEQTAFGASVPSVYGLYLSSSLVAVVLSLPVIGAYLIMSSEVAALGALGKAARHAPWFPIITLMLAFVLFQVTIRGYFTSRMQNLVWSRTASPNLRFNCQLRARDLSLLIARNSLLMVLTLGLFFPFAAVATARLRLTALNIDTQVDIEQLVGCAGNADDEAAGDAAADLLGLDIGL
jgi:uncharacterized membrane protein YjgN (DUF898 family)